MGTICIHAYLYIRNIPSFNILVIRQLHQKVSQKWSYIWREKMYLVLVSTKSIIKLVRWPQQQMPKCQLSPAKEDIICVSHYCADGKLHINTECSSYPRLASATGWTNNHFTYTISQSWLLVCGVRVHYVATHLFGVN